MKRYLIVFLIMSALLLLAAGCGSEGSTEAAEAESNEVAEAEPVEEEQVDEHEEGEDEHMDDHEEGEDEHMDDHEEEEDEHMDDHEEGEADQMDHMHAEPPEEFASLKNPFSDDSGAIVNSDAIAEGQKIYETLCARCHGEKGLGDGRDGKLFDMDPKPANLADRDMMSDLSDGYLFWRVSKGGEFEPFNSVMPAWEGLPEDSRWKVISYVRTLSEG